MGNQKQDDAAATKKNNKTTIAGNDQKTTSSKRIPKKNKQAKESASTNEIKKHKKEEEKENVRTANDDAHRSGNTSSNENRHISSTFVESNATVSSSSQTKKEIPTNAKSLSDRELVDIIKPGTIDYEDRVNDTALLPPNNSQSSQSSSPVPPISSQSLPEVASTNANANANAKSSKQTSPSSNLVSSLTSENEILSATNNFLVQENKSLRAENESLQNKLDESKQQSVEAVQRVQLKAYIAETARDAAEERAMRLESMLSDAMARLAAKEAALRNQVEETMSGTMAFPSSIQQQQQPQQQQQQHDSLPIPPPPQAMHHGYHMRQTPRSSLTLTAAALPSLSSMGGITHNGILGGPLPQPAPPHNYRGENDGISSLFPNAPQSSMSNDFWEPPWMMQNDNPSSGGGSRRESVLSRLRRGDHA